jgi:quercetin dioxygenase-like cupin family protein
VRRINGARVYGLEPAGADVETVEASVTGGAYSVLVGVFPPGHVPSLHRHPHTDELFYVGDGEASFRVGDETFTVAPGGAVFVPRGVAHTAWASGDRPARGVLVISPGDAEHVVEAVADA